jgi:tRNA U54 and U55 pseudouridine synthase Pus10
MSNSNPVRRVHKRDNEHTTNMDGVDFIHTDEEHTLLLAMQKYMKESNRKFPTFTEVLSVVKSLGYRKVEQPTPLPIYVRNPTIKRTRACDKFRTNGMPNASKKVRVKVRGGACQVQ